MVGAVLIVAMGLVTPILATAVQTPTSADMVVSGCTIVSNPTPTDYTNCPGADLAGANLSGVNLSYSNLSDAQLVGPPNCNSSPIGSAPHCATTQLTDANLTQANLSGASFIGCFFPPDTSGYCLNEDLTGANLSGANLTNADAEEAIFSGDALAGAILTDANVAGAVLNNANLTGADLTGTTFVATNPIPSAPTPIMAQLFRATVTDTILIPSNQTVPATSQAGAVVTWSAPSEPLSLSFGACSSASGSTIPLFGSTLTCQIKDGDGDVATGTFQVYVTPTSQWFTRILIPSNGAVLTGAPYLDAAAGDGPGVSKVVFELSGGAFSHHVIATATPTLFGWLAQWNTTGVPYGTYSLQSVATDADNTIDTSTPVSVIVNLQPPSTAVLIPSGGASVSGTTSLLDASASSQAGIASVTFELTGGTLSDDVIATGTPTIYGWLAQWNTTAVVPNGTYSLQSVATDTAAESTTSAPVSITVDNPAPTTAVLIPSNMATQSGMSALLDASASANVTFVKFELSGGALPSDDVISVGFPTIYGWLGQWDTTSVPNGTYTLTSLAFYANGLGGTSPPITISVSN